MHIIQTRLTEAERAHSATELEAMSLVYAIRHWSPYLRTQKFTAIVDHHALVWLVTRPARTSNGRILHWIADLMEYRFDIVHRAGKQHVDADAVSRLLHYQELAKEFSVNERPINETEGQACRPLEGDDVQDMHRRAEIQKQYYEFIIGIRETYSKMQKYPEYFRMITSKDYIRNALKMVEYEDKSDNESRRKLEEELDEMENERKVEGQIISGQEFLDVKDLKIEDSDEERNEEYEINVRKLLMSTQPCQIVNPIPTAVADPVQNRIVK